MINRRTATVAPIAETSGRRSARLRLRVAWMYYAEEMTQGAIAEKLIAIAANAIDTKAAFLGGSQGRC